MLAGPYFSRAEAEGYFERHRYRYPKQARVYCFSGYESPPWCELRQAAMALAEGAS